MYKLTKETLYDVCEEVPHGEDIIELAKAMALVMYDGRGIGLASNQIGSNKRVIIINVGNFTKVIINPIITKKSIQTLKSVEGCLSFPMQKATIVRHKQVTVQGFTPDWKPIKQKLRGIAAICVQHEIDHLNGVTCIKEGE